MGKLGKGGGGGGVTKGRVMKYLLTVVTKWLCFCFGLKACDIPFCFLFYFSH